MMFMFHGSISPRSARPTRISTGSSTLCDSATTDPSNECGDFKEALGSDTSGLTPDDRSPDLSSIGSGFAGGLRFWSSINLDSCNKRTFIWPDRDAHDSLRCFDHRLS